jgi:hypothetical protein
VEIGDAQVPVVVEPVEDPVEAVAQCDDEAEAVELGA